MLDTNIASSMMREPSGRVTQRLLALGEGVACVSIVTAAEMRFGAIRVGSARLIAQVERVLTRIPPIPMAAPVDGIYANIRSVLESTGRPIGAHDYLIAAHALTLDLTLVTANIREFSRVPNLRVENWLD